MLYLHKLLFFIIKSVFKLYNSSNIDRNLQFISNSVDYGNSLLGKGATSIQPEKEIELIKKFLNDNLEIVFDIGANVGVYSDLLLTNFNIKNFFLFEPSKKSYTELTDKFQNIDNLRILNFGLSDKTKQVPFYANFEASSGSSVYKRKLDHFNTTFIEQEKIDLIKFDDFYTEEIKGKSIDFMKLDIEGHEYFALEGMKNCINSIKLIQFEFGGCNIDSRTYFQDFYYYFNEFDFDIYRMRPNGLIKINSYKESDEYFHYSNFLAVNKRYL
jgi:FkbM family methyltransferase